MSRTIRERLISSILSIVSEWFNRHSWVGLGALEELRHPLEQMLSAREAISCGEWVPVEKGLPAREREVPALVVHRERRHWVKAVYAAHGTLELSDDHNVFPGCVTSEDGTVYVPEGWYCVNDDETCTPVQGVVTAWLDLVFPMS